jgi:hypothetical protein
VIFDEVTLGLDELNDEYDKMIGDDGMAPYPWDGRPPRIEFYNREDAEPVVVRDKEDAPMCESALLMLKYINEHDETVSGDIARDLGYSLRLVRIHLKQLRDDSLVEYRGYKIGKMIGYIYWQKEK